MCNGDSQKVSQGSAIAILHWPKHVSHSEANHAGDIQFQNQHSEITGTTLLFRSNSMSKIPRAKLHCVIQYDSSSCASVTNHVSKDGDLTKPFAQAGILHQFEIGPMASDDKFGKIASYHRFTIKPRLELGAGPTGVIGHRVSIFEDGSMNKQVAEGVVGWN
jgi:hypothetical protein